jgi:thiol reductant ABC exporter CydD subunit
MKLNDRLLRQASRARAELVITVALGGLAGILLVLQARFLSRTVNLVFLEGKALGDVESLLLLLLFVAVLRAGASWASQVAAGQAANRVKIDLRQRLSTHLLTLGPAYTRSERSGELTNTVVEGIEALDAYFSQYLPQLALATIVPLTVLICVFSLDKLSALVLVLTAPLIPLFTALIGDRANALTKRQWLSLSRMSAHFLDVLQGLTTLKLLGRSRDQIKTIAEISDRYRRTTLGVLRVAFLSALVMEMVATLSTAIVAVEIGLRLLRSGVAFEEALFILVLAPEFYLPLRLLGTRFHVAMTGVAAAQRIFDVLDAGESEVKVTIRGEGAVNAQPVLEHGQNLDRNILFDDVHYVYDDGERQALNGLSFHIAPGQKVALVGPSGAGKSTVVYLLLRFIEPQQGQITVAGRRLQDIPASAWREQVAWVPQNPYLFHASVADNIRLACEDAALDDVAQAARQAHAHEFIVELPQGYDTVVGERGSRLSAGQAQRVALARAFLKDAPILVLDEATSSLDPIHEALIGEAIERLTRGRTVLIIGHRLNTICSADQILVMDDGRIVETGTHSTLTEDGGLYSRMVNASGLASEQDGIHIGLRYGEAI